jgi:2-iminobutanoate/2-iminopropanoate deaminase
MTRTLLAVLCAGGLLAGCAGREATVAYFKPGKVIGPYTPGVRAGNFLFVSGQIAIDPATGDLKSGSIEEETNQVLDNLEALLRASGYSAADVVSATVYLTDMKNYSIVNGLYGKRFPEGRYPARVAVQVSALPRGANIEIAAIAYRE